MSWLRPPRSQHVLSEVKLASVCHWMHKYEEVNITPPSVSCGPEVKVLELNQLPSEKQTLLWFPGFHLFQLRSVSRLVFWWSDHRRRTFPQETRTRTSGPATDCDGKRSRYKKLRNRESMHLFFCILMIFVIHVLAYLCWVCWLWIFMMWPSKETIIRLQTGGGSEIQFQQNKIKVQNEVSHFVIDNNILWNC